MFLFNLVSEYNSNTTYNQDENDHSKYVTTNLEEVNETQSNKLVFEDDIKYKLIEERNKKLKIVYFFNL